MIRGLILFSICFSFFQSSFGVAKEFSIPNDPLNSSHIHFLLLHSYFEARQTVSQCYFEKVSRKDPKAKKEYFETVSRLDSTWTKKHLIDQKKKRDQEWDFVTSHYLYGLEDEQRKQVAGIDHILKRLPVIVSHLPKLLRENDCQNGAFASYENGINATSHTLVGQRTTVHSFYRPLFRDLVKYCQTGDQALLENHGIKPFDHWIIELARELKEDRCVEFVKDIQSIVSPVFLDIYQKDYNEYEAGISPVWKNLLADILKTKDSQDAFVRQLKKFPDQVIPKPYGIPKSYPSAHDSRQNMRLFSRDYERLIEITIQAAGESSFLQKEIMREKKRSIREKFQSLTFLKYYLFSDEFGTGKKSAFSKLYYDLMRGDPEKYLRAFFRVNQALQETLSDSGRSLKTENLFHLVVSALRQEFKDLSHLELKRLSFHILGFTSQNYPGELTAFHMMSAKGVALYQRVGVPTLDRLFSRYSEYLISDGQFQTLPVGVSFLLELNRLYLNLKSYYAKSADTHISEARKTLSKSLQKRLQENSPLNDTPIGRLSRLNRMYHFWGSALVGCELGKRGYPVFLSSKATSMLGHRYENTTDLSASKVKQMDIEMHEIAGLLGARLCSEYQSDFINVLREIL